MKIQWLMPTEHEVKLGVILCGNFRAENRGKYGVIRDTKFGYNTVRVDWERTDTDPVEQANVLATLLTLTQVKYEQMRDTHE
jgi:hypothetical protein